MRVLAPFAKHMLQQTTRTPRTFEGESHPMPPLKTPYRALQKTQKQKHEGLHQGRSIPKATDNTDPTTGKVMVLPIIHPMSQVFWPLANS